MVDVGRGVSPKVSLPSKGKLSAKESLSFLVKGIDDTFSAVDKALEFLPNSFTTKLASGGGLFVTPISPVMRRRLIDYFEKLKYIVIKDLRKSEIQDHHKRLAINNPNSMD
ncbi:hypothetical protein ACLKA6_008021 [Drosophila palustris]